jgi:predicted nucleic acid-binding protein
MCSEELQLIAPEFLLVELEGHRAEVLKKAALSEKVFEGLLDMFRERIEVIQNEEFGNFMPEATSLSPDPDDVPYFALALRFNCPIWSRDMRLKRQTRVKVFSTEELIELLGL